MTRSTKRTTVPQGRNYTPTTVPFAARPVGETPGISQWAHRAVWTDRMLTTLMNNQVKGGRWHALPSMQR